MSRRPIGIAASSFAIHVVCNDGSHFARTFGDSTGWRELQPIPGTVADGAPEEPDFIGGGATFPVINARGGSLQ